MNIVVVVPGGLTEALQAAPLLATLPTATDEPLMVACAAATAPVVGRLDGVDEILAVPGLGRHPGPLALGRLWAALRSRRLDVAIVCSRSAAVHLAVHLAAAPRRIGCAGRLSSAFLTDRVECAGDGNVARSWEGLGGAVGASHAPAPGGYRSTDAATADAERLVLSNGIVDGRLLVAIAPGFGFAEGAVSTWSAERCAHLANRLASRHGAGIVLVGDDRDREVADAMRIDLAADTLDLCGEADLATTAAVLKRCDLLVGADTPLLHLAAAVGTSSVGLFGPTDGRVRAPAGGEHRVVQALPNGRAASLDHIRVDDVLAGIESTL